MLSYNTEVHVGTAHTLTKSSGPFVQVYSKSTGSLVGAGDSEVWAAEWANLEADLFAIASAGSADQQHRITARMHRSYLAFRS